MSFTFLVDSDLHFRNVIKPTKADHVDKILDLSRKERISALICPGDLTNDGYNGAKLLCWYYGGDENQVGALKKQYVDIISNWMPVYLCAGNHDYYVPWPYITHPVINYIKDKHGDIRYSFDIGNVHFICLSKYPDKKGIKFLKKDLRLNKGKNMVIFFHFNLTGKWSNWWTEEEKETFYNVIRFHNILALLVGHAHISQTSYWKDYLVISGASRSIAKCKYDAERNKIDVEYF